MTTKGIDRNDGKSNDLAGRQTDVKRIGHETKAVNDLREKLLKTATAFLLKLLCDKAVACY